MPKIFTHGREQRVPIPLPAIRIADRAKEAAAIAGQLATLPHLVRFEYGIFDGGLQVFATVFCSDEWDEAALYKEVLRVADQIAALVALAD